MNRFDMVNVVDGHHPVKDLSIAYKKVINRDGEGVLDGIGRIEAVNIVNGITVVGSALVGSWVDD